MDQTIRFKKLIPNIMGGQYADVNINDRVFSANPA